VPSGISLKAKGTEATEITEDTEGNETDGTRPGSSLIDGTEATEITEDNRGTTRRERSFLLGVLCVLCGLS
jgi:hypothetical protein